MHELWITFSFISMGPIPDFPSQFRQQVDYRKDKKGLSRFGCQCRSGIFMWEGSLKTRSLPENGYGDRD
jgi:hypothetical protein